ncbi:MAG: hypothetical protein AAF799_15585 [Myxococcota bacterium]
MSKVGLSTTVEIPDGLGSAATRSVSLTFARPTEFRLTEVIKQVEVLSTLSGIAAELTKKGNLDAAVRKVEAAVGRGKLIEAIEQLRSGAANEAPAPAPAVTQAPAPAPEPAPSPAPETSSGGSALDAIFGKADVASPATSAEPTAAAKSGLDAFIGAMRGSKSSSTTTQKRGTPIEREVAQLIDGAVESTALDLMAAATVSDLESAWRGLRMVVSASPGADDLGIDLVDTNADALVAHLGPRLDVPPMERPDAVFVALPVNTIEKLQALAELGARSRVPIVVEIPEGTTGAWLDDLPEAAPAPEGWTELRKNESTSWLCAASNAVVLANEQNKLARRIVFGSPVWGVASMISASVGQTGGPGQIFGRAGALVSPASHQLGEDEGSPTVATERLASIDRQRALAARGVLVLGSEQGTDRLRLAAAPMVQPGQHDLTLPGRILAGRASRLTQAVRDDLPPQATSQELAARLADASTNFLPRSPRGAVALEVRTDAQGEPAVHTSIGAALAGASFNFDSDL